MIKKEKNKDLKEYGVIRVRLTSKDLFESIAFKYSKKHIDLFDEMCQRFNETLIFKKLVPATNSIDIEANLKIAKNQIIGFIKTQEQDFLFPLLKKVQFIEKVLLDNLKTDTNLLNKEESLKKEKPFLIKEEVENKKNEIKEIFLTVLSQIKRKKPLLGESYFEIEKMSHQDILRLKELIESL